MIWMLLVACVGEPEVGEHVEAGIEIEPAAAVLYLDGEEVERCEEAEVNVAITDVDVRIECRGSSLSVAWWTWLDMSEHRLSAVHLSSEQPTSYAADVEAEAVWSDRWTGYIVGDLDGQRAVYTVDVAL